MIDYGPRLGSQWSLELEKIPLMMEIPHRTLFPVNNHDFFVCRLELLFENPLKPSAV